MHYSSHRFSTTSTLELRVIAGILLAVLVFTVSSTGIADAQDYPPFPILYGGIVLADGEPVPEGTRLSAQVGDYETWTNVEENGKYRNLLLGPPDDSYYGKEITFHVLGNIAIEKDTFLPADAPVFKDVEYNLNILTDEESSELENPSGANWTTPLLIVLGVVGTAVAVTVIIAVWRKRA